MEIKSTPPNSLNVCRLVYFTDKPRYSISSHSIIFTLEIANGWSNIANDNLRHLSLEN